MEIATPAFRRSHDFVHQLIQNQQNLSDSMSQDYHQGIFNFSNGFERSQQEQQQQQQHVAQQIRRDKLRVQGFEPPPQLVGIEEEESDGIPAYETGGMLSEMFNFPSGGGAASATELLENQIMQSYRNSRAAPVAGAADWFPHRQGMVVGRNLGDSKNHTVVSDASAHHHHHQQQHHHQISSINAADSAAAMQLFLINPQQQQRSPSPSPSHPPPSTSSTLHMLLPNPSSSSSTLQALQAAPAGAAFGQYTWIPNNGSGNNPNELPGVVEGQGLSLSLSSSLQHLEAAKVEELRNMGEGGMLFFGHGGGPTPPPYQFKNLGGGGLSHHSHQFGSNSFGTANLLRNSKYAKAAQELLEEFCSVGRGQYKRNKFTKQNNNNNNSGNPSSNPSAGGGAGNSSSSSKDIPPLSAADRIEHQRRKVKLLSMLEEVDRRYNHYCEQMQMVVNSFDMVMGFGAAVPYTCLAQKAMSRHFRCLKDAIADQLKHSCELLGENDIGTSGVTKGETPRLRVLEQSLRQQRAFHQMGMMEQEAWRPQRGLPERSVNILRAWLFEHFLHPYPSDADKHLLARQTGLSRNQVSNWFINARVRLWKPMIEEMYQQEAKENEGAAEDGQDRDQSSTSAQTPTPLPATETAAATSSTARRPDAINAPENDHSFSAINRQCFPDNHAKLSSSSSQNPTTGGVSLLLPNAAATAAQSVLEQQAGEANRYHPINADVESTVIRFGTSAGDVSLTLGLRHAGNLPEKSPFSVREFGGC